MGQILGRAILAGGMATVLSLPAMAAGGTWQIDPNHSSAQFAVRHLGLSTVRGAFTKVSGTANLDDKDISKSTVEVVIDANSVDTRVANRDNDLRSDHFFDVAKYPTITFKSKKVEQVTPGKLKVTGDLTIHGVTRMVTIPIQARLSGSQIQLAGSITFPFSEFGMTPPSIGGFVSVQDNATMEFAINLVHEAA